MKADLFCQTFLAVSRIPKNKKEVAQGGVLSPTLFNLYMSKLPLPPGNIQIVSYVDDITIAISGPVLENLASEMNSYLAKLHQWLCSRNLSLSAEKSTTSVLTTWSAEQKHVPNVHVNGKQLPKESHPKILGVTLDSQLTFNEHTRKVCEKVQNRNNVLRKIAGTTWGCSKETLNTTFKAIGRSVINYAAPIWTPTISQTNLKKIQMKKNAALRTVLGCTRMTDAGHLHQETETLPVQEHNNLLSKQFLLRFFQRDKVDHHTVNQQQNRNLKPTLEAKFKNDVVDLIDKKTHTTHAAYKEGLKILHTREVRRHINSTTSKVLGCKPPAINPEEQRLLRESRCKLSQLGSGYSTLLNSYNHRIKDTIPNACNACGKGPHNTHHLFNCEARRTNLTVESLWTHPIDAAVFVGLETSEAMTQPATQDTTNTQDSLAASLPQVTGGRGLTVLTTEARSQPSHQSSRTTTPLQ